MKGYVTFFSELGRFTQVACFLDCCRIREISIGCNGPQVKNVKPGGGAGATEVVYAYATEFDNLAYEAAINSGGPVRGHFTRALMEGLRGAAAGPSPGAGYARLAGYVKRRTTELATLNGQKQKAYIPMSPLEEESWTFGKYPPTYLVQINLSNGLTGPIAIQGPTGKVIASGLQPGTRWKEPLEPAWHIVKDVGSGKEKQFRVIPQKNSEVQNEDF
jgi:hypothetical protein